jgi:hypothetical protein
MFFSYVALGFGKEPKRLFHEESGEMQTLYTNISRLETTSLDKNIEGHEKMTKMKLILLAVVAIVIIAIILIAQSLYSNSLPKPPIDVNPSIDTSSIKVGQYATITISMKNNDLKTHQIEFYFETSPKISVFAGTESKLVDNRYAITMDATSVGDTRAFTLTGTLDSQAASSTFPLVLHVTVDGTELQKTWGDFSIQVSAS